MKFSSRFRYSWLAGLVACLILSCSFNTPEGLPNVAGSGETTDVLTSTIATDTTATDIATDPIATDTAEQIRVDPLPVPANLQNSWTREQENQFWVRANHAIAYFAEKGYGNTYGENEKRSYPLAMFDFLAGDRQRALDHLQSEDAQSGDHAHTEGIDYYYAFTLKGQIRKYFFFGQWLDPSYRQRMFEGAQRWTEEDPNDRPHPQYGDGRGGDGWGPEVRGGWVDGRNTDNLRAMREVAVYLMAEETGNETVRELYKDKLQRYVKTLYHIGMGEWDSENYHGHTLAAYLNLYDFAKDPEVQALGKAALDWLTAAGAVKYYRGAWGGPTKRDHGDNVVYGSAAARLMWQYFGDSVGSPPEPERDAIHVITSAYRPPQAVVALAHRQFDRPVELLASKPTYENWLPGRDESPAYWETTFWGHTYQMGSVVSSFADGDVGPFKVLVDNSQRGVDYFVANTGREWLKAGKREGDQVGQYRNLLIWLRPATDDSFFFQIPKTARREIEDGIWFFEFENTWFAVHPINLSAYSLVTPDEDDADEDLMNEVVLKSESDGDRYSGFALEVGEPQTHGSFEAFKRAVLNQSQLDLDAIAQGDAQLTGTTGETLRLIHNSDNELPIVIRNGMKYDWDDHRELYHSTDGNAPISLGWKQGTLRVEAGGKVFETTVAADGRASRSVPCQRFVLRCVK